MLKDRLRMLLKKIIDQHQLTGKFGNFSGSSYCYPNQVDRIHSKLVGEKNTENTITFIDQTETEFSEEYNKLKKLFDNIAFNPYSRKPYKPAYYYEESYIYSKLENLFKYKEKPNTRKNILVIGERGSGKTALINNWFNKNHDQLNQNNIFWVRCDGEELYNFWMENVKYLEEKPSIITALNNLASSLMEEGKFKVAEPYYTRALDITEKIYDQEHPSVVNALNNLASSYTKQGKSEKATLLYKRALKITEKTQAAVYHTQESFISLEEYFDIRFIYIFAKFCFEDDVLLKKMLSLMEKLVPKYQYHTGRNDPDQTTTRNIYDGVQELNKTINRSEAVDNIDYTKKVMKISSVSKGRQKRRWLSLSKALQKFLADNDIWILKVADGVDNIKVEEESSKHYYEHMLNEIYSFMYYQPFRKQLHLMALRLLTYSDACRGPKTPRKHIDILRLQNNEIPLKRIWESRLTFIRPKLISDFFSNICSCVMESMLVTSEVPFNYNVRDFLHNKLSLIALVYYRCKQLGGAVSRRRICEIIKAFENRNLYLNGRLYLNTYKENDIISNEHGICYVNLFYYYNPSVYYHQNQGLPWQGLCRTRILQILLHFKIFEKTTLKQDLSRDFGYDKVVIDAAIKQLEYYRMINSSCCSKDIYVTITTKGKEYLNISYSDVTSLYYFALDTPLPTELVIRPLIEAHENKLNKTTGFPYTSICTTITFISFLISVNKIEMNKLSSSTTINNREPSASEEIFKLPFMREPNFSNLWKSIASLLDSANEQETNDIHKYLDEYAQLVE